jgi:hypothetical protein
MYKNIILKIFFLKIYFCNNVYGMGHKGLMWDNHVHLNLIKKDTNAIPKLPLSHLFYC